MDGSLPKDTRATAQNLVQKSSKSDDFAKIRENVVAHCKVIKVIPNFIVIELNFIVSYIFKLGVRCFSLVLNVTQ